VIPRLPGPPRDQPPPLVLVADEDPNVVHALARALETGHFRVATALDGDEALRRARQDEPELVVAGWRLPKRSGLELCEALRREPERGDLPILLLANGDDPELRVEALAHGADELVTRPFSPRELLARAHRLVARARLSARHRHRSAELERDVHRLEHAVRRASEQAAEERELRSLAGGVLSELLRAPDLEVLDARLLREACRLSGARSAVLLARRGDAYAPVAVRGDLVERWQDFELPAADTCLDWLRTLGRPMTREELERLPGMPAEIGRLATHGVALVVALPGDDDGAEAVLAIDDRADGMPLGESERARLGALCAAAAVARATARRFREQQDRALELLSATHSTDPRRRDASLEALQRITPLATPLGLGDRECEQLQLALRLGPWAWTEQGRGALLGLASTDATRRLKSLLDLLRDADRCARGERGADEDVLAWLVAAGLRYQSLRIGGRSRYESWRTTGAWLGIPTRPELRPHFPEAAQRVR